MSDDEHDRSPRSTSTARLSRRDTLVPFLAQVGGRRRFAQVCGRLGLAGARRIGRSARPRRASRSSCSRELFAGRDEQELRHLGARYARDLLSDQLRPDVLARLEDHRRRRPRGRVRLGLAGVLPGAARRAARTSRACWRSNRPRRRSTHRRRSCRPNVRAEQKAVRLREWLGAAGRRAARRRPSCGGTATPRVTTHCCAMSDHALLAGAAEQGPAGAQVFTPGPIPA